MMLNYLYYSDIHKQVNSPIHDDLNMDVNCVGIVAIRVEPLVHVPQIENDNSQINRGKTHRSRAISTSSTLIT